MADYDKDVVTPLLRRRAHLVEVGADAGKLAELDNALRVAGYPADGDSMLDERVEQEKPGSAPDDAEKDAKRVAPKERSAKPVSKASVPESGSRPSSTASKS